ncbi:MAG TPA: alkaline phosphatase family protein [Thermoplasmata archaeon]|nr:alkaline phosphatase family protein [Thermoplasmata archaeon]
MTAAPAPEYRSWRPAAPPRTQRPSRPADEPSRLLVIGLDGVPPDLLFRRLRGVMPNMDRLLGRASRGALRTTDPPISVPAWPVMFTGVDPGTLGLYGFRHRRRGSYTDTYVPGSEAVPVPTIWELASQSGRRVAVVGMPLGYPPPSVNGVYVSDFLTPPGAENVTHPPEWRTELDLGGPYLFDVPFRSSERNDLFGNLMEMTRRRFDVAEKLYRQERWDVFAVHEIGTDRLHHAFWKYFDPEHPDFEPHHPLGHVLHDYYAMLDAAIGRLVELADAQTHVVVVSDHGSMAMHGLFCVNEWLRRRGYLAVRAPPAPQTAVENADVDWSATRVWAGGGYYARIFFNVRGREPQGVIAPEELPEWKARLSAELRELTAPDGGPLGVEILDPSTTYHSVRGDAPDLIAYFGALRWRSAGTLGHPSLYLRENDIGPDDAVHSFDGVFVHADPSSPVERELPTSRILDMAPTFLQMLGEPVPSFMQGRPIARPQPLAAS